MYGCVWPKGHRLSNKRFYFKLLVRNAPEIPKITQAIALTLGHPPELKC